MSTESVMPSNPLILCFYLFIFFGCAEPSLQPRLLSSCGAPASHCGVFSCPRPQALEHAGFSSCGSGPKSTGSAVVEHGLSCSEACGISRTQRSNPCLLYRQVSSLPLSRQGSPGRSFLLVAAPFPLIIKPDVQCMFAGPQTGYSC